MNFKDSHTLTELDFREFCVIEESHKLVFCCCFFMWFTKCGVQLQKRILSLLWFENSYVTFECHVCNMFSCIRLQAFFPRNSTPFDINMCVSHNGFFQTWHVDIVKIPNYVGPDRTLFWMGPSVHSWYVCLRTNDKTSIDKRSKSDDIHHWFTSLSKSTTGGTFPFQTKQ